MTFEDPTKKVEFVKMPEAAKKAEGLLSQYKIDPLDFSDLYDRNVIEQDIRAVELLRTKFEDSETETYERVNKQLAEIFEAIIFDQGESSEWFGPNAFLIKTADFDDFKNGVDAVVEYDEEQGVSRLAMAIDVTFNHNVKKKVADIEEGIRKGILGRIKYFVSEVSNMRGELTKIPRIIIGADVDTVRELTNLWAEEKTRDLAKHPVQFQFFDQAIEQCVYFAKYARENNQTEIAEEYDKIKVVLERAYSQKQKTIGPDAGVRDSMMDDLHRWFGLR